MPENVLGHEIFNKGSIMRAVIILMAGFLACLQAVAVGDADAGAAKAKDCTGCHNSIVSLKGRGADAIAGQTKAIRSGTERHPPAGVEELSDEDIADIAAYLDGA